MNKPFVNWKKKNEILPQHNEKLYHCKAVDLAKMFATGIGKSYSDNNSNRQSDETPEYRGK